MTNQLKHQVKPLGSPRPIFYAEITYKGRSVAKLEGYDRNQLIARAHRYAQNLNYHRAVVQVTQTVKQDTAV